MLYRGMDRTALDAGYNNTEAVGIAKRDQYVAARVARSDAFRKTHPGRIDVHYGAGARQRLDVFACGAAGAPTLVFHPRRVLAAERQGAVRLPRRRTPAGRLQPRGGRVHAGPGRADG